ncbi:glycerophosphoryl diester phosphodiesterase membrane domain-containing protein [Haloferacaceae archaeon DSL9]
MRWAINLPLLLAAFVVLEFIHTAGEVSLLFSLLSFLGGLFLGGVAYVYAEAELRGTAVDFGEAAEPVVRRFLSLIGIFVGYIVAVAIGFALLILPGIYLGARLILAFPACVLDDRDTFDSFATSWEVAGGNVLKLVGIFILGFVAALGVSVVGWITAGGLESSTLFLLVTAPLSGLITAVVELSIARVYLENKRLI